jgi:HK97 family phage prohead protease
VTITIDASALRARERMLKRYGKAISSMGPRFAKSITIKDDADDEPRLCIEGLGVELDTLIVNKHGEIILIEPKAFDEYFASGKRPMVWLEHDQTKVVGANAELCLLDEAVAFRIPLTNSHYATVAKQLIQSGTHTSVSIGYHELRGRNEVHFGHNVRHIEEASIHEISICPRGASKKAFARIINAKCEPPLHESVNTTMFAIEYDWHNVSRLKEENEIDIDRIKSRLSALQTGIDNDEQFALSMTSDQCNRIVTERYDDMISERRSNMHRM